MTITDLKLGLGTWKAPADKAGAVVEFALMEAEYNHIDCAAIYRNEKEIGEAFARVFGSSRKREDVFITSKLWNTEHKAERVMPACKNTLADLQLDYLDLYLMHWGIAIPPNESEALNVHGRLKEQLDANGYLVTEKVSVCETWEAMEGLVKAGLVKAIGVANFTAPMIQDLLSYTTIAPATNQIELHPYLQQTALVEYCHYNNIAVTAYSPQGSPGNYGKAKNMPVIAEDPVIMDIAKRHRKSPTQIMIRWAIQRNTIPIPKSLDPVHIKENIDVFDFELSADDMQAIATLNRDLHFVNPYAWWKIPYFN
ncbi:MAG: aldo/keto reductase [Patescibacteria group bacterium]|mgnify:CR=1 FL=1